jgi:hypothetical protein
MASSPHPKHANLCSKQLEALNRLLGSYPVLDGLMKRGEELSRDSYIDSNWFGEKPNSISACLGSIGSNFSSLLMGMA